MIDRSALEALDELVEGALASGHEEDLRVLGYGEISLVLGWPVDDPKTAAKRLPAFPAPEPASEYGELIRRYLDALTDRGIEPVESEVHQLDRPDGSAVLYVTQRLLDPASLAPAWIEARDDDEGRRLVRRLVETIAEGVDEHVGLDAQITNWAVDGDRLLYFDVTTPFLRDDAGHPLMDADIFIAALPPVLRPPVRRFVAPGLLARYHRARDVLLDFASNLGRFGLGRFRPVVTERSRELFDTPITLDEVERYYRSDSRLWKFLFRVRKLDRAWQQRVRRRPYPFLLPRSSDW